MTVCVCVCVGECIAVCRLLFEAVTARDGGEYSCNVSSLQGELGAVATAVVTVRPTSMLVN